MVSELPVADDRIVPLLVRVLPLTLSVIALPEDNMTLLFIVVAPLVVVVTAAPVRLKVPVFDPADLAIVRVPLPVGLTAMLPLAPVCTVPVKLSGTVIVRLTFGWEVPESI